MRATNLRPQSGPNLSIPASNLAYVIYTSGTTGLPKGVLTQHNAVQNRLAWGQDLFCLKENEKHLQKTPYTFDVSVPEIFWPLQNGACLVVCKPGGHREPAYLRDLLQDEQINVVHFVPSMLRAFLQQEAQLKLPDLRHVYCSGEALSQQLVDLCFSKLAQVELYNLYGPTEAAVEVSYWRCHPNQPSCESVPLGHPVQNTQLHVLDEKLQPVPMGKVGELYIGGVQVARGYWERPELNADAFIDDPFDADGAGRLYRTGDLASLRSDGALEYSGRKDSQIKLRGYRIELGEIESALCSFPGVTAAAACVRKVNDSDHRLVGFVQSDSSVELDTNDVRKQLTQKIPSYMIPQEIFTLLEIPSTSSGKVDRKELERLAATLAHRARSGSSTATSSRETVVARIWARSLDIETQELFSEDNFFDVGGHSLLAMEVLRIIEAVFEVRLTLQDLVYNTLCGVALLLPEASLAQLNSAYDAATSEQITPRPSRGLFRKVMSIVSNDR